MGLVLDQSLRSLYFYGTCSYICYTFAGKRSVSADRLLIFAYRMFISADKTAVSA